MQNNSKSQFRDIFNHWTVANTPTEKQKILNDLSLENLDLFTRYVFNEDYKGNVSENDLQAISSNIIQAKIMHGMNDLPQNPSQKTIQEKLEKIFEIKDQNFSSLANFLWENKSDKEHKHYEPYTISAALQKRLNEEPDFLEKYFNWLIKIFKDLTKEREARIASATKEEAAAREEYEEKKSIHEKLHSLDEKIKDINLKAKHEVEIIQSHLVKKENAFNFPKQKAASKNNSMHPVTKVTKIVDINDNGSDKAKQEWYKKEASDDGSKSLLKFFAISDPAKREVVCAEIMRFFIPETPKYRIFKEAGKTYVVAQGVGYNKDKHKYFKNIETYYDHLNGHIFQPKDLSKILLASMIAGSSDCHTDNIMCANGKIFPIDFGRGTIDYEALMKSKDMIDTWHGMKPVKAFDKTYETFKSFNNIGQYNDEISEAAKEISNLYVNHKDKLITRIQNVCKALDVPENEMKKTIEYMEKNYQYGVKKQYLCQEDQVKNVKAHYEGVHKADNNMKYAVI